MVFEIRLPRFGEGTEDATLVEWLVRQGESFEAGAPLVSFETAKAIVDVEAPQPGVLRRVLAESGNDVPVGSILAVCSTTRDEPIGQHEPALPLAASEPEPEFVRQQQGEHAVPGAGRESLAGPAMNSRVIASPAARRLAREHAIELAHVAGTGASGRIRAADVAAAIEARAHDSATAPAVGPSSPELEADIGSSRAAFSDANRRTLDHRVGNSGTQVTGARDVTETWRAVPIVTVLDRSDITRLHEHQERYNRRPDNQPVSLAAIVTRVTAIGLRRFPELSTATGPAAQESANQHSPDIGIVLNLQSGPLAYVVRNAGAKPIIEIARELADVTYSAHSRTFTSHELNELPFVVEDLGAIGGTGFTPIVAPNVAILGFSRATVEPIWSFEREAFEPRLMLPLSLTVDHRLTDRARAAQFLHWVCEALAEPFLWIL